MHCFNRGYREGNQGIAVACDWLCLLKDSQGNVHNPWSKDPISILELGCGNGKLCKFLSDMNFEVTGLDIVDCLYDRSGYKFIKEDLTTDSMRFNYGEFDYCISFDVLEHLPEEYIADVLEDMARISSNVILKVASSGIPPLHVTVRTPGWWMNQLIVNCPDFSWRLIGSYQPHPDNKVKAYSPMFYGKKDTNTKYEEGVKHENRNLHISKPA